MKKLTSLMLTSCTVILLMSAGTALGGQSVSNLVIVAKSGGDFNSIQAAIDSVMPTETSPYVIQIMPGTFVENVSITKSYLTLQGYGQPKVVGQVTVNGAQNVAIENLKINGGVNIQYSGTEVKNNSITGGLGATASDLVAVGNDITGEVIGIGIGYGGTKTIILDGNNVFRDQEALGSVNGIGINFDHAQTQLNIEIKNNTVNGFAYGIYGRATLAVIKDNTVGNLIETYDKGIAVGCGKSKVLGNLVIGTPRTSSSDNADIWVSPYCPANDLPVANISFNTYNSIINLVSSATGQFNVTQSGGIAPSP